MSELEGFSIKATKPEKQREQRWKKQNKISRDFGTIAKGVTYMQWDHQNEKKVKNKGGIWNSSDSEFFQINVRYQTTDLRSSENSKHDKCQKSYTCIYRFPLEKTRDKQKISWKKLEKENTLSLKEQLQPASQRACKQEERKWNI